MTGPVWSFNTPIFDELAARIGPIAATFGFRAVQVFGWPRDPVDSVLRKSVLGAKLEFVPGAQFASDSERTAHPRTMLSAARFWQQHISDAKAFKAIEYAVYLEGWCAMRDCDGWTMANAKRAAIDVARGCTKMLAAGVTPIIYGPAWRPTSYPDWTPFGRFCNLLARFFPAGARLWEEPEHGPDGVPVGDLSQHPLDRQRYLAWQRVGNWGGVEPKRFLDLATAYGGLGRAIYYGDPAAVLPDGSKLIDLMS